MKKVLLLAYHFPPVAASGSLRPVGLCRYLREFGFETHVVCADPASIHPPVGRDTTLEALVPPWVRVDRIQYRSTLKELLELRDRIRLTIRPKSAARQRQDIHDNEADVEPSLKDVVLDRLFIFPDHQKDWVRPVVGHVCALPSSHRPDIILATGNPWSSLLAGVRIARRLAIPLVADFRDPWSRNPKPQPNARLLPQIAKLERGVLQAATRVIANTEALRDSLISDHPSAAGKTNAITNGFIEDMIPQNAAHCYKDGPVELCHYGSVYPLRHPRTLLEAMTDLAASGVLAPGGLRIRFVGTWDTGDARCDELASRLESQGFIIREPTMPREDALRSMSLASHLMILQQGFPLQIPAKLYEYIAVGRPVVVIGGEGATSNLVNKYGLGACCPNEIQALRRLLSDIVSKTRSIPAPDTASIERFNYRKIAGRVAQTLEQAIGMPART
jgi:glycosyltransferase involved in cell wall biosynthesis